MKPTIGMEIHVELKTDSKMFCSCPAAHFAVKANTQTCPVCLGLPGALPVPNQKAIDWTIMIGLALNCEIARESKFDRKHYFYPDLPKGYQISQYDEPFCFKGNIHTPSGDVQITRVHLEEDTAKLQHKEIDGKKVTLVDFNRSSVPLVEIVTEPVITSAKHAKEYAQKIHQLVRYLGVSDADMEKGSMRVEANISWGIDLKYKVEVKNINSFKFLEKAIDFELKRQRELLDQGITPKQETRGFNESKSETYSQRSKEAAEDYRYFPDPDIPPILLSLEAIDTLKQNLPVLPDIFKAKLINEYGIRPDYADILTETKTKVDFALECIKIAKDKGYEPIEVINFLINRGSSINDTAIFFDKFTTASNKPTASTQDISFMIDQVVSANPDMVNKIKTGKTAVIGALVGEVMKLSKGQADPKTVNQLIQKKLAE